MRKFFGVALAVAGAFLFVPAAHAQFTTVSATVKDPNGIPYAGGTMSAVLVPGASGGYTLNGAPYSGQVGPVTLDSTGKFIANFGDVTMITPGSPQWRITIDSNQGGIESPLGTGGQTFVFTSTGTTISGSSPVDISTSLNALAPKLTNITVGGGSVTSVSATSPIVATPNPITGAGTLSCPGCVTASGGGSITIAANQVAFGSGANTIVGSANLTYTSGVFNAQSSACPLTPFLTLTACGNNVGFGGGPVEIIQTSTTPPNGCGLVMSNSNSTGNTGSSRAIYTCFDQITAGGFAMGQVFPSGALGALNFVGTGASQGNMEIGTNLANGSDFVQFFTNNDGTSGLTSTNGGAVSFPPILNLINTAGISAVVTFAGGSSGLAAIGVAAAAGTPCKIFLPITSPTVGQVLSSAAPSGGNCQTSWSTPSTVATAVPLSGITAATGSNTIASGNNPQTWNFALTTDAIDAMAFGETSAATGGTLTNGLANQALLMSATATNSTATPFELVQGSITNTVATPLMQLETTWNNAGLTAAGIVLNVTNTASAAGSLLENLQVGNVSQWKVDKAGNATAFSNTTNQGTVQGASFPLTFSFSGIAITQGGTPGTTSYTYALVGVDATGRTRTYTQQTNLGNATLNGTNFNIITTGAWSGTSPFVLPIGSCNVYRTVGGATQGIIGTIASCSAGGVLNDTGLTGDSTTPPADTSGVITASVYNSGTTPILTYPNSDISSLAVGFGALAADPCTNGDAGSVAVGYFALHVQTVCNGNNTAVGWRALSSLTTGGSNTAIGTSALAAATTGAANTGVGLNALALLVSGTNCTGVGYNVLPTATACPNDGFGRFTGRYISTGVNNAAFGTLALGGAVGAPTTGSNNSAFGANALALVQGAAAGNTGIGTNACSTLTTGSNVVCVGLNTVPGAVTDTNEIVIGQATTGNGSNTAVIGNVNVTDVYEGSATAAAKHHSQSYLTASNCSSSAAPAVCGSASAGSVVVAAAGTTVTVNTTAVTANSQIFLLADDTLGTKLGVTCNSTLATLVGGLAVTARTGGTSFQITSGTTPAVNPLCLSYFIVN